MKVLYADKKTENCCTSLKAALKLFGGNRVLAQSLLRRVDAIHSMPVLKDLILVPTFHFHSLYGKRAGTFAIDVKSRRDKWRIILIPLDENEQPFEPCHIDEIAPFVKIIEIEEVSAHYE